MDEILEKYTVWVNEPSVVHITHGNLVALFDGPQILLMKGRQVLFQKKYDTPKAAKKKFIEKVKKYFT